MLQAFRLELQYAAMKRQQQHEKETKDKNAVGEGSCATALLDKEAHHLPGHRDGQRQETGEVSDQVHNRVEKAVSGHKAVTQGV
jgi:transposase